MVGVVNTAAPLTTPVTGSGVPTVGVAACGVPGSTGTVMVWLPECTALEAVTVKVSVLLGVALCCWAALGV